MRTAVLFSALSVIDADRCVSCRTGPRGYNFTDWEELYNEDCWDDDVSFKIFFDYDL